MHRSQYIGQTVRHLRRMALAGAAPDELEAFLLARIGKIWFYRADDAGTGLLAEQSLRLHEGRRRRETNPKWSRLIEEKRDEWQREPVPELMRLRDYFGFMQFCQQEKVRAFVVGANPAAGPWIGAPRVGCYDGSVPVLSRVEAPNAGLLAADPTDARLAALLAGSYATDRIRDVCRAARSAGSARRRPGRGIHRRGSGGAASTRRTGCSACTR